MKKVISAVVLVFFAVAGLGLQTLSAQEYSAKKVQRLDRKMTTKRAVKKRFRTQKEYQRMKRQGRISPKKQISKRGAKRVSGSRSGRYADRGYTRDRWYGDSWDYPRGPRQRGYRNFKRGWYLAYRYDRASFYDRYGYHYGYFNRYGFEFDGIFYRYDRYYGYRDRVRGRGLFDNSYYMPANAVRYGFCPQRPVRPRPLPFIGW